MYILHFRYFRSNRYLQALKVAAFARNHEVYGEKPYLWHSVHFEDDQIDEMARLYDLVKSYPPTVDGIDTRLWSQFQSDIGRVVVKLKQCGYLERCTFDEGYIPPQKLPGEFDPVYVKIRKLISLGKHEKAVQEYYGTLDNQPYGELNSELLYLKRIGGIQIAGRDLLAFLTESSRSDLIKENIWEYCSCIDTAIQTLRSIGRKTPIDILIETVPTLDELLEREQHKYKNLMIWKDGQLQTDVAKVTPDWLGEMCCPKGRLFDRYPSPLIPHYLFADEASPKNAFEYGLGLEIYLPALWTTLTPSTYNTEIITKGKRLHLIQTYEHERWQIGQGEERKPDFVSLVSMDDVKTATYAVNRVRFTGRTHQIYCKSFYEVDLLRKASEDIGDIPDSLEDLVAELLVEAENLLREEHGLPRIGEGWVSEMRLYNLVKEVFPGAEHHSTPTWLRPQHLDVFVPSKQIAFEYQGQQHFEPVDFFGGEEAFEATKKRDRRKKQKCRLNGVTLIYWRYDEQININTLESKLH